MMGALWPLPFFSLLQNKPWQPPTALTIQHGVNGTTPLVCQRGITAITRSALLANSPVHSFNSVFFGSHDNFSAPSVLPSQ